MGSKAQGLKARGVGVKDSGSAHSLVDCLQYPASRTLASARK